MPLTFHPLTPDRWDQLEALFRSGQQAGCWCMWWRMPRAEFDAAGREGRRRALAALVAGGSRPGILAYDGVVPVGWCSVAPRREFPRLTNPRSRTFKPFDDADAWVVNCFVVAKDHRRSGVARALLDAAVRFAEGEGAGIVEAHPHDTSLGPVSTDGLYVGTLAMFLEAGFQEVDRRGNRPLVRLSLR